MEIAYARALIRSVEGGKTPADAVTSLVHILKARGRTALIPRILRAVRRIAEGDALTSPRVYVAHEKDGKAAFAASGISEADVVVDETLIGGWRAENGEVLIDASFKKMLLDMYNRAVA